MFTDIEEKQAHRSAIANLAITKSSFEDIKKFSRITSDRLLSGLNGIIDPHLLKSIHQAEIKTAFYKNRVPIKMTREVFRENYPNPNRKIAVFLHGLCCHEEDWQPGSKDRRSFAAQLEEEAAITSLFIRYNTGLSLRENGDRIASLFEELREVYPVEINEIVLVGHSQGGLLAKAALISAAKKSMRWQNNVKKVFLIGSPLSGSYVAKLAGLTSQILRLIRNRTTDIIANVIDLRSPAIKGLMHGSDYTDDEIKNIPAEIKFIKIGAGLGKTENSIVTKLFGDGLVRTDSVKAESKLPGETHFIHGAGHLQILTDTRVFDILRANIV